MGWLGLGQGMSRLQGAVGVRVDVGVSAGPSWGESSTGFGAVAAVNSGVAVGR